MKQKTMLLIHFCISVLFLSVMPLETAAAELPLIGGEASPSQQPIRIFLAGEIGGFEEGRNLVAPRGGIDGLKKAIGCLEKGGSDCQEYNKLIPSPTEADLKLMMGNTLARESKASNWDLQAGLPLAFLAAPPSEHEPRWSGVWKRIKFSYAQMNLDLIHCQDMLMTALNITQADDITQMLGKLDERTPEVEEAFRQCRRDLLLWKVEEAGFGAVAVGAGDLNAVLGVDPKALAAAGIRRKPWDTILRELRFHPFVASNLFLASESTEKKIKELEKPFGFNRQIFPTDAIRIQLKKAGVDLKDLVTRVELQRAGLTMTLYTDVNEVHAVVDSSGGSYTLIFDASVNIKEKTLTINWPLPLTPGTRYRIRVDYEDKSFKKAEFDTFETFTRTDVVGRSGRPPAAAPQLGTPYLRRTGDSPRDSAQPWLDMPWNLGGRLPIVVHEGLRIIAVLDEEAESTLPRPADSDLAGRSGILHRLNFLTMEKAISYYSQLALWADRHQAILKLLGQFSVPPGSPEAPIYSEILRLSFEDVKAQAESSEAKIRSKAMLGLAMIRQQKLEEQTQTRSDEEGESRLAEAEAWNDLTSPSTCTASENAQAPCIDWRVDLIRKVVGYFQKHPSLVLLNQTERERLEELLRKTAIFGRGGVAEGPEVVLAAGASRKDEATRFHPGQGSSTLDFPVLYPDQFAESLDVLELEPERISDPKSKVPNRERQWRHRRFQVFGIQEQVLFEEEAPGRVRLQDFRPFVGMAEKVFPEGDKPPTAGQVKKDGDLLARGIADKMRRFAGAEVAVLDKGTFDPEVLRAARSLYWISQGNRLDLSNASLATLQYLPMVDQDLAKDILLAGVKSTDTLEAFFKKLFDLCTPEDCRFASLRQVDDIMSWYRWITEDGGRNEPHVDVSLFLDQLFSRLIAVNDEIIKLTMTKDQLKTFLDERDDSGVEFIVVGIENTSKPRLHGLKLEGDLPVTVVIPSRISEGGKSVTPVLNSKAILREAPRFSCADSSNRLDGTLITLRRLLEELADPKCVPGALSHQQPVPTTSVARPRPNPALAAASSASDIKRLIADYDRRFFWRFSLEKLNFEWRKIAVTDNFRGGVTDDLAQAMDERRFKLFPEFLLGLYWPRVDVQTVSKLEFERSRTADNPLNVLEDLWSVRTQLDYYAFDTKEGYSFPLYFSVERLNQLRAPIGSSSVMAIGQEEAATAQQDDATSPQPQPVELPFKKPKRSEWNGEIGLLVTNEKRSRFFQFGYIYGKAIGVIESDDEVIPKPEVTLIEGDVPVLPVPINDDLDPTQFFGVKVTTRDRIQHGLSLKAKYEREFGPETRRFQFTTELSDFRFFFNRSGDTKSQTRLRLLWETELKIPVFGNLSLMPGYRFFALHPKLTGMEEMEEMADMGIREEKRDNFFRNEPYIKIEYSFDFTQPFMDFWKALTFKK